MNDDELRRRIHDAVSDVEPRDALDSIHARTKVSPMQGRRPWLIGVAAAVLLIAGTVGAVTLLGGDSTTGGGPDVAAPATSKSPRPSPSPSPSESSTPSEEPSPSGSATPAPVVEAVPVYYVGDTSRGLRLYREFHRVDTEGQKVSAAVNEAVSKDPDDPDYHTDWPLGTTAAELDVAPTDVISLDVRGDALHGRPDGMGRKQAEVAIQQLIYTAQAARQSRDPVQFFLNGDRTDTLLGVPVSEPLAHGDAMDVLAQVWIVEPGEGAEVAAPFRVTGLAAAFEAQVEWRLVQDGNVVKKGFTTAAECCRMAPYAFTVKAPPGDYTLVVNDSDPSGGEGFAPWEDTKRITVLP